MLFSNHTFAIFHNNFFSFLFEFLFFIIITILHFNVPLLSSRIDGICPEKIEPIFHIFHQQIVDPSSFLPTTCSNLSLFRLIARFLLIMSTTQSLSLNILLCSLKIISLLITSSFDSCLSPSKALSLCLTALNYLPLVAFSKLFLFTSTM